MCGAKQEQAGEWEQERSELSKEIGELKEHNERLVSELSTKSMTTDELKNKVGLCDNLLCLRCFDTVGWALGKASGL